MNAVQRNRPQASQQRMAAANLALPGPSVRTFVPLPYKHLRVSHILSHIRLEKRENTKENAKHHAVCMCEPFSR